MKANLVKTFNKTKFLLKQKSPEIMIIGGAICAVTGAVLACKKTLEMPAIIDEAAAELDAIRVEQEKNPEEHYGKELTQVYLKTGAKIVKNYALPVAIGGFGIGAMMASNNIMRKRNASLAAACATTESMFKRYRENVIEKYGKEVDHDMRFGVKEEEVEVKTVDSKGKEKVKIEKQTGIKPIEDYSDYARFFDESCFEYDDNPEYNLAFLKGVQTEANRELRKKGHLFLNEVYDMLGIKRSIAGQSVGWIFDEDNCIGDNYIDFGIYQTWVQNRMFVNGYEPVILLDFNVDGVIVDKLYQHGDISK